MADKIFYLTRSKLKELKKEYQDLVNLEHGRQLSQEMPKILESEDLNPEFVSFQEDVGFMRARMDELKNILENYELIKPPAKHEQNIVGIGSKVNIEVGGKNDEFIIVGTLEANPALGKISNESPVGRALMGHKIGDEIIMPHPMRSTYKIKNIKYEIS